jgi:hypothetical protein
MSVRESSSATGGAIAETAPEVFTRWPGLLRLSLGVLLGPTVALINQQGIYSVNMWACGRGMRATMHIVPVLCLLVTLWAAWSAYSDWTAVGRGVEDEAATIATRTRFLSLVGIAVSLFSSLVILAQWAAIFVFDPCMRA